MPDEFDPYLAWLGIASTARPPNHYQLLGLPEWECNRTRIAAAADARMGEVRSYQTGPRGKFTQKILNELSVAKLCLLDARAKEAYDVGLVRQRAASLPAAAQPVAIMYVPVEAPPPVSPPAVPPPAPPPTTPARRPSSPAALPSDVPDETSAFSRWWLGLGLFFLVVIVGAGAAVYYRWPFSQPPREEVVKIDEPDKTSPAPPPKEVPLIILQEGSGDLSFPASTAELSEGLQRREVAGESLIEGWQAETTVARWRFKIIRPAVFQVRIVYAAQQAEGDWQLRIGEEIKTRGLQVSAAGEPFVTDEFFWRVPRGGEHTFELSLTALPAETPVTLKSVRFIFQGGQLK